MELQKMTFICVFMFLMSRKALCQNVDRKEAIHYTIKDQDKHMQKREHQGLMLKLGQPLILSKPITQTRPQMIQEARTQTIPRPTMHEIPQALQQSSRTILQRPINLRLNTAANLQRRVTNASHRNNTIPSQVPISHPEVPKDLDIKAVPQKQETVSTPVPNNSVVHMLIPKETPDSDKNHKPAEFFEDDTQDNTPIYHPKYLNEIAVNDKHQNNHETKDQNLDNIVENKKPKKIYLNNPEIKANSDHNDTNNNNDHITNKLRELKINKLNSMDDDQSGIHNITQFSQETSKDDEVTMKTTQKQPVPKTTNKTDKNKFQNNLMHSLTKNNYTGDNIISIKARKGENRKINQKSTSTPQIQNDLINNVLIQNNTYEEIYERSIHSNPAVLYNTRSSNIQTPEYSMDSDKYQEINGEYKSPVYVSAEDYNNQHPSTSDIKCEYNKYTNSYENDPNLFFNQENKPSVEYMNENQINSNLYDKPTNLDVTDYYPKVPDNYIDRIWRTWRNTEVHINNNVYKPNNENMDCNLEVPSGRIDYIKDPVNAVTPITNGNVIGVNGYYKNQNKPVTCRYCPSYQCYY